jgi:hypothetical protein
VGSNPTAGTTKYKHTIAFFAIAMWGNVGKHKKTPDTSKKLSLHPLSMDEAIKALLKAKPPAKAKKPKPSS